MQWSSNMCSLRKLMRFVDFLSRFSSCLVGFFLNSSGFLSLSVCLSLSLSWVQAFQTHWAFYRIYRYIHGCVCACVMHFFTQPSKAITLKLTGIGWRSGWEVGGGRITVFEQSTVEFACLCVYIRALTWFIEFHTKSKERDSHLLVNSRVCLDTAWSCLWIEFRILTESERERVH